MVFEYRVSTRESLNQTQKHEKMEWIRYSRDYSSLFDEIVPSKNEQETVAVSCTNTKSTKSGQKAKLEDDLTTTKPCANLATKQIPKVNVVSVPDAKKVSTQPVGSKNQAGSMRMIKNPRLEKIRYSRDYSFLFTDENPVSGVKGVPQVPKLKRVSAPDVKKVSTQPVGSKNEVDSMKTAKKPKSETMRNSRDYSFLTDKRELKKESATVIPKGLIKKEGLTKTTVKNVSSSTTRREGSENHDMKKTRGEQRSRDPVKENLQEKKSKTLKRKVSVSDDEEEDPIAIIRKLFRYDPTSYRDNYNCDNMEASFADIEKEERRSAKLARIEDQLEQQKLDEERRRSRKKQCRISVS